MVDTVANVLVETLRDLLIEEAKFLLGVSDEVKKVEENLKTIHAMLMEADANKAKADSPVFRDCITRLTKLAFRAENVLETYAVKVQYKKQGKSLKKKLQRYVQILCKCYNVHQVRNEISDIRSSLADLTADLKSIPGAGEGSSSSADQEEKRLSRLTFAHEEEQHFVGMEKDINLLLTKVKDESPQSPSVISIYGMGGLGKSTLARKIYNHHDIQGRFNGRAWVCVTQQFQADIILRDILKQITGQSPDNDETHDALVRGMNDVLVNKKCLILIDDIWEANHWNIIKPAFPTNCKVVLTTRKENIVSHECYVHKLEFLTVEEGWELLGKIALAIHGDQNHVLESRLKLFEDIGKQIIQKCGCLPLAISIIGGILRQKQPTLAEWEEVSRNMDTYLRHGGDGIGKDERVKQILDLSFDVLPFYLKPCFLYLACFPEDEEINAERLYRLWLAEGLISSEEKGENETLRDVAQRYLAELAFRCMVQVIKPKLFSPHNKFESCRLHDLMRDLCSSKAEEEKFLKRADICGNQHDITSFTGASIQRLAINLLDKDISSLSKNCLQEVKDLRSVLVLGKFGKDGKYDNILNFKNSKQLRILVFENLSFEDVHLPSTISKLIHLKYLGLYYCEVKELPRHICDLPYLQTLDLSNYNMIAIKLPNYIWKMKRLRHLFLPEWMEVIGGGKLRLDGLYELETLENINSESACILDIVNLKNLRKLNATIKEDEDSLSKIVDFMSNNGCQLRETWLRIVSCELRNVVEKMLMIPSLACLEMMECEIGRSFPSYTQSMCHNLVFLWISDSKIEGDAMEVLGKFPLLQDLWLGEELGEMVKGEMRFGANSYPELRILRLRNLVNLNKWEVEKGAMPKLRELDISGCINLVTLPDGLRFIPTLEEFICHQMSKEFTDRMRRGENGERFANFSHIPKINIW